MMNEHAPLGVPVSGRPGGLWGTTASGVELPTVPRPAVATMATPLRIALYRNAVSYAEGPVSRGRGAISENAALIIRRSLGYRTDAR